VTLENIETVPTILQSRSQCTVYLDRPPCNRREATDCQTWLQEPCRAVPYCANWPWPDGVGMLCAYTLKGTGGRVGPGLLQPA
jgi:hypothetical protein